MFSASCGSHVTNAGSIKLIPQNLFNLQLVWRSLFFLSRKFEKGQPRDLGCYDCQQIYSFSVIILLFHYFSPRPQTDTHTYTHLTVQTTKLLFSQYT